MSWINKSRLVKDAQDWVKTKKYNKPAQANAIASRLIPTLEKLESKEGPASKLAGRMI